MGWSWPSRVCSFDSVQSIWSKPYLEHIFPDAIVVCGRHFAVITYVDPGFKLAHGVRDVLVEFKEKYGKAPKIIFLENHGPFILGQSDIDVINTMQMLDKWSKVILANQLFGGSNYLAKTESDRIENRLDKPIAMGVPVRARALALYIRPSFLVVAWIWRYVLATWVGVSLEVSIKVLLSKTTSGLGFLVTNKNMDSPLCLNGDNDELSILAESNVRTDRLG